MNTQSIVFDSIVRERKRQERLHGEFNANSSPFDHVYMTILVEELGESAQALFNYHANPGIESFEEYRAEVTQVAAVAVAILEKLVQLENTIS